MIGIFLAIGKWYPGLGRRAGGLAPNALARGRGRARDRRRRPDDRGPERAPPRAAAAARSPRTTSAPSWRPTSAGARSCAAARASASPRHGAAAAGEPPPAAAPRPRTTDLARVLIVGCGCRGRALGAALAGEGTRCVAPLARRRGSLSLKRRASREWLPIRIGSAPSCRALAGVTVVCWLMGSAADSPDVHGARLRSLMEHLVDTPVRGLVYEAAGTVDAGAAGRGRLDRARGVTHLAHTGGDSRHRPGAPEAGSRR